MTEEVKLPIQPIIKTDGVLRFKRNRIVDDLLKTHHEMDMNTIALRSYTKEERKQFAQLIGYSVSGFCNLSYSDGNLDYQTFEYMINGDDPKDARIKALEEEVEYLNGVLSKIRDHIDDMI